MKNRKRNILLGASASIAALVAIRNTIKKLTDYTLKDKVLVITGGSRGLGLVLARQAAAEGAKVAVCARNEEELQAAKKDLSAISNTILTLPCDLTRKEDIIQMIERVKEQWGTVDVLINNAGIIQVGPASEMTESDYEQAMKIHFWAPLHTIQQVVPIMKIKKQGRIINISSIGGKISFPHLLPYNASKFALAGLSEGLYAELKQYGINVTTVYPGLMRTGSPRNINVKGKNKLEYAWFKISDSIPFFTIKAEKAAKQILKAAKSGKAKLIISWPAKLAISLHDLILEPFLNLMALTNQLLPNPARAYGQQNIKGYESESKVSRSFLTRLTNKAARRNNETMKK